MGTGKYANLSFIYVKKQSRRAGGLHPYRLFDVFFIEADDAGFPVDYDRRKRTALVPAPNLRHALVFLALFKLIDVDEFIFDSEIVKKFLRALAPHARAERVYPDRAFIAPVDF